MDDNAAPSEEPLIISPEQKRTHVKLGIALMALAGVLSVASCTCLGMVLNTYNVERLFCFRIYAAGVTPLTKSFIVILAWWTVFSMSLVIVNFMLTKAFFKARYEFVYKWSPQFSAMNALGTNVTIVTGLVIVFSSNCSNDMAAFGILFILLGCVLAGLSLWMCTLRRPSSSSDEWISTKSIRVTTANDLFNVT